MINHTTIFDITMTDDFYRDYDNVPKRIKLRMNRIIEMIQESGRLPNSFNTRPATQEMWMGNVTQNSQAYRVLFWLDEATGVVTFHRLLSHDQRDHYLDNL